MNRNDYPLWLKIAVKFPLKWKHWLRAKLEMAEYWSERLVLEDSWELCKLIENTDTPDFETFDRKLGEVKKTWGKYDSYIAGLEVHRRLLEFKQEHKKK